MCSENYSAKLNLLHDFLAFATLMSSGWVQWRS